MIRRAGGTPGRRTPIVDEADPAGNQSGLIFRGDVKRSAVPTCECSRLPSHFRRMLKTIRQKKTAASRHERPPKRGETSTNRRRSVVRTDRMSAAGQQQGSGTDVPRCATPNECAATRRPGRSVSDQTRMGRQIDREIGAAGIRLRQRRSRACRVARRREPVREFGCGHAHCFGRAGCRNGRRVRRPTRVMRVRRHDACPLTLGHARRAMLLGRGTLRTPVTCNSARSRCGSRTRRHRIRLAARRLRRPRRHPRRLCRRRIAVARILRAGRHACGGGGTR